MEKHQKRTSFEDGQVGIETTMDKLKESHVLNSYLVQTLLTKLLELVPGKTSENLSKLLQLVPGKTSENLELIAWNYHFGTS